MWLIKMAWKNLWRNRNRSLITMSSIFFAVVLATLVSSLQKGVFDNLIKNVVSFYSGYIQVHQNGYWNEQILDNSMEWSKGTEKIIARQNGVSSIAARLESFALASSEQLTKGCLVTGIVPEAETRVTRLKDKLASGNYLNDMDEEVLLSEGLAERLKLKLHDTLVLIGQGYHGATAAGKYRIKGIVRFGSPQLNNETVFLPLQAAQELYAAEGRVTSYVLGVRSPEKIKDLALALSSSLGREYEVLTWEDMMPGIRQHISTDSASMSIIIGILYLLICFGIFGTLLMMMVERKFEMGMLVAIGMKKRKLCWLLLAESIFTVLLGCVIGIMASIPVVNYLYRHPIRMRGDIANIYERFGFEAIFPTANDPAIFLKQGIIVLLLALLLSMYPLIRVLRLRPVDAIRR